MAIESVIAKIKENADTQRQDIIKEANAEKDKILADWKKKADELYTNERKRIENESENEKRSIVLAKRLELRKEVLSAKQKVIDDAFEKAFESMKSMPAKEYESFLEELMKQSAEGGEEVIYKKEDKSVIEKVIKKVGKSLKLSKETRNISGGFILLKNKVETVVSFETLFDVKRHEIEQEVGKLLNVF